MANLPLYQAARGRTPTTFSPRLTWSRLARVLRARVRAYVALAVGSNAGVERQKTLPTNTDGVQYVGKTQGILMSDLSNRCRGTPKSRVEADAVNFAPLYFVSYVLLNTWFVV